MLWIIKIYIKITIHKIIDINFNVTFELTKKGNIYNTKQKK